MKKVLILFLLILVTAFPQRQREKPPIGFLNKMYTDILHVPGNTSTAIYLTYKIPYNTLVFEKEGETFSAGYRISAELFTDSDKFIDRQIKEEKVSTGVFSKTNSEILFEEGFLQFELQPGTYELITQFTDLKSRKEMRVRTGTIKVEPSVKYFQPIIVSLEEKCENNTYMLSNYEGNIPFNQKEYDIFIPVKNADAEYLVELVNNKNRYFSKVVKPENSGLLSLKFCDENIYLNFTGQNSDVSFIHISPGAELMEGELTISLMNKDKVPLQAFKTNIRWYDKPRTLMNREIAVRLLKYIDENESSYDYVSDADEDEFDSLFFNYWKQYDPTPFNSFNELMYEYYKRADYAAVNFSSLKGYTGLESDRAKIYIKFGKPVKVERRSNEKGKVIEVWEYANRKTFSFIDEKGTGEFTLVNG